VDNKKRNIEDEGGLEMVRTVKELIEELEKCDSDDIVYLEGISSDIQTKLKIRYNKQEI
jgi:hypothetical protein